MPCSPGSPGDPLCPVGPGGPLFPGCPSAPDSPGPPLGPDGPCCPGNPYYKYVSLRLRVQNRRKKWNFPLNFRTMRKLSDLYSGIFQNY